MGVAPTDNSFVSYHDSLGKNFGDVDSYGAL